jgi:hypothetical protein
MARVQLDVTTNFAEASREMKRFGTVVKKESREYAELVKKYDNNALDKLAEKHRRLASAVRATRGPQEAAVVHQRNLRKEIEKLISQGLDPQDERLKKLRDDYAKASEAVSLNTEAEKRAKDEKKRANAEAAAARQKTIDEEKRVAQAAKDRAEAQKRAAEAAKKSYLAVAAALAAFTAAVVKNTLAVAKNGDEYAKTGSILGITAEEYQELIFAADRSGVSQGQLTTALFKMNEELGKVQTGTGSLTTLLRDSNPELLRQLETAEGTSDAFNIMMEAIGGANSEQERAALASAVWGRAGRRMINIALEGGEGIASLREEARQYGLISNESAAMSEKFVDSQTNLKAALTGLQNILGVGVMPMLIRATDTVTELIGSLSDEEINQFGDSVKVVFKGLLIGAGAVAAGINNVVSFFNTRMNGLVTGSFSLLRGLSSFAITQLDSIATIREYFGADVTEMRNTVQQLREFEILMDRSAAESAETAAAGVSAWEERDRVIRSYIETIDQAMNMEAELSSGDGVDLFGAGDGVDLFGAGDGAGEIDKGDSPELFENKLREKLSVLQNIEAESNNERIAQFEEFFQQRIAQERVDGEERFNLLQEEFARIQDLESLSREEKLAAEIALNQQLDELRGEQLEKDREASQARLAFIQQTIAVASGLIGSLVEIQKNAGKENRALLIIQRAAAVAEIGINTAVAVSKALASDEPPRNFIQAGIVGAAGATQAVAAATTPIPAAETGVDRFVVPDSGGVARADGIGMKVNAGEEVSVAPRGESLGGNQTINVILDNEIVYSVVNKGIESGEIIINDDNIRQVA